MNQTRAGKKVGFFATICAVVVGHFLISVLITDTAAAQESTYDEMVQKDLKAAYTIAQTLFTDNPRERVDLSNLRNYGFRPTEDVTIRVLDGSKQGLLVKGKHDSSMNVYWVDKDGTVADDEEESGRNRRGRGRK